MSGGRRLPPGGNSLSSTIPDRKDAMVQLVTRMME
jgi:hypothetical protein